MMPLPGRWLTALLTRYNGSSLLIDCGEGTQITMKEHAWSFKSVDTMANAERTEPLTIIGPRGLERVVSGLRVIAPELPFEIKLMEAVDDQTIELHGYHITPFRLQHSMPCLGYSLEIKRAGRFDAERAKAQQIPLKYWNPLQKGETIEADGVTYTPDMVLGKPRRGLKVTYCTDTRPIARIAEHAAGSDLFICEGMYGDPEKLEKAKEHRHMTMYDAARLAAEAKPAQLWLTHYSPSMIHPEWYMKDVKKIFPAAQAGEDGKSITLNFDEE